ncbi:uncharacterized protein LOC117339179 isoform X2 [Pecten maximus]|uniref:uncharacterized protein LOC117339179 isoform X2 n=1 Tax=Pecten maximus TaxID=6579 RepID=UPI001458D1DB|nr:uncharacterized protein LOC117339179 isoform X2 [Pecten maximus]
MASGQTGKEFIKDTSLKKGSSIDSYSDKSSDSAETQDYVGLGSPSVSEKSNEKLPVLREEATLVDDMITPTDSLDGEEEAACFEKRDSQSPNFKKGRGSKKLKVATRFQSDECDTEVSFRNLPDTPDLDVAPSVPMWEPPQQTSTTVVDSRRGKRTHQYQQENEVQKKSKPEPISLVPCPLCSVPFPMDQIEAHAAECEGGEDTNNANSAVREDADDGSFSRKPAEGAMGFFQNSQSPHQVNLLSPQKHKTGRANDNSAKDMTVEATEPVRQMMMCYLCDEKFPVGQEYDHHIEICLKEAQQRQAEADARGYVGARTLHVTPEKRSTRSSNKEEQGSKFLGQLDQAWHQTEGD